jgi:tetratricopeptide (TPR) repeat protein
VADDPEVGSVVDRYTLLEKVGAGGAGWVYSAYDAKLDRKVALKVLRRRSEEYEALLMREARAMARLSHPNVVAVFDTGVIGERVYLAMEFVHGGSLRRWQRSARRGWREVVRAYIEAGHGLSAAHAAGLVHRDFKPDNVLVTEEGAVKVADFGIARSFEERKPVEVPIVEPAEPPSPADAPPTIPPPLDSVPSGDVLSADMTLQGTLRGTVGYMAPEQFLNETIDARTDQFAFCVSLYEALYGERPFPGSTAEEVSAATLLGVVREAPNGSDIPARIRRILVRGLQRDRERRYSSMEALIDDLLRDPARLRARLALVALSVGALAATGVWAQRAMATRQGQLCAGADSEAREVWSSEVQAGIERALVATGLPYAQDTWQRTRAQIDSYLGQWRAMHTEACRATRVDHKQPEPVMDLRMACLEHARQAVHALAQTLDNADAKVVAEAVPAALSLPKLDVCADVKALRASEPLPDDAAKRAEIQALRAELAAATAKLDAGRYADARTDAEGLLTRARATGYHSLTAEILLVAALAGTSLGGVAREVRTEEVRQAAIEADLGGADSARARAAAQLMDCMHYTCLAGTDLWSWARFAEAALDRSGDQGIGRVEWLGARAHLAWSAGALQESLELNQAGLATARRAGLSPRYVARFLSGISGTQVRMGLLIDAARTAGDADELIARTFGPEHPMRVDTLQNRAFVLAEADDPGGAIVFTRQAIAIAEKSSPDSPLLPVLYGNAGDELNGIHDYAGAFDAGTKAIALGLRLYGPERAKMLILLTHINLAEALRGMGRNDEAIIHASETLTGLEGLPPGGRATPELVALVELGIAELRVGRTRDAAASLERAVSLANNPDLEKSAQVDGNLVDARFYLAQALWQLGQRTPRVRELAEAALATSRRLKHDAQATEIASWIERAL